MQVLAQVYKKELGT